MAVHLDTADVLARVADLVDECRWKFDLVQIAFHERIGHHPVPFLEQLHILGSDSDGSILWYSTGDMWVGGTLIEARVDAGGFCVEGRDLDELTNRASFHIPEHELYPVLSGMARQLG